jgi:tetratricopeptide (TPR) repeat protein
MSNPPSLMTIQQTLSEADWPTVFSALRNDQLVWQAFSDPDFIQLAVAHNGPDPAAWSPANLALLRLGIELDAAALRHDEQRPLPGGVRKQAVMVFDQRRRTVGEGLQGLAEAGWLALALRERYRMMKSWHGLLEEIGTEHLGNWSTAFACLYGMLPNPVEWMKTLATDENGQIVILNSILSQPEGLERKAGILAQIIQNLPVTARLRLIRTCAERAPALVQAMAGLLLHGNTNASDQGELLSTDRTSLGEAGALDLLPQHYYETTLLAVSDQQEQVRLRASQTQRLLQSLASRMMTQEILAALATGDYGSALQTIETHATAFQSEDRQSLALALLAGGHADKALELAGQDHNSALYLLLQSHLLQKDAHTAAAQATILTAYEHAIESHYATASLTLLDEIAASLVNLNRPVEAGHLYRLLCDFKPDEAGYYARLAYAERLAGSSEPAVEAACMAVALQPANLDHRSELASALESAGDWQAAYETRQAIFNRLHKTTKATSGSAKTWIQTEHLRVLARSALQAGHTDQAQVLAQQALEQAPEDGMVHMILGEIYQANGNANLALQHYETANDLSPSAHETWLALSSVYLANGDHEKALETLKMGAQAVPDAPELHLVLGDMLNEAEQLTDALHHYHKAAELLKLPLAEFDQDAIRPGQPAAKPKRPYLDARAAGVYLRLGKTYNQLGRYDEARQVLAVPFATQEHRHDSAPFYAKSLMATGEYREALSALSIAFKSDQPDKTLAMDYARALIQVGESPERAVEVLRVLLSEEPENYEAIGLMAEALAASGDLHKAMEYYQKAMDTRLIEDPAWFVRLAIGLGHVALELGKTNLALATLQEATQSAPNHTALHQKLSEAYRAANLDEDAFAAARRCLELAPADLANLVWFSEIALQLGEDTEAIATLKRAVELSPNETGLLLKMAQVQLRAGEREAAHQNYSRMAANPGVTLNQLHHVARGLLELGDAAGAVACLERLREPSLPSVDPISIDLLMDLAEAYELVHNNPAALAVYEEILARNPHLVSAHKRKARLHIQLEAPLAALACLEHALQLAPGDREAHQMLMGIHHAEGNLNQAILHAQKAAAATRQALHSAEAWEAQYQAAVLNWLSLDFQAAYKELQTKLDEGNFDASQEAIHYLSLKAMLEFELGMETEAIKTIDLLDARVTDQPDALAAQAQLLLIEGEVQQARALLSRAMSSAKGGDLYAAASFAAIVTAALLLADFQSARQALDSWFKLEPCEPLPFLLQMKYLVLQAEEQQFLTLLQVVEHAPGGQAVGTEIADSFKQALAGALGHLPGGEPGQNDRLTNPYIPDAIKTWLVRGEAIFGLQTQDTALHLLANLKPGSGNTFAHTLALVRSGQMYQVAGSTSEHDHHPRLLALKSIAMLDTDPTHAMAAALEAIERAASVHDHELIAPVSDGMIHSHKSQMPVYNALLALTAFRVGDPTQAMQAITTALEAWPDEPRWHKLAAEICRTLGDSRGMIQHLEKNLSLAPGDLEEEVDLAEAYLAASLHNKAIQLYEKIFEQNNSSSRIAMRLAEIQLLREDTTQAEVWLQKTIKLDAGSVDAHLLYADLCLLASDYRQAHRHIETALDLQPDNPITLHKLARCLEAQNRKEEAIQVLEQVIEFAEDPLPIALERAALIRSVHGVKRAIETLIPLNEQYAQHPAVVTQLAEYLHEHGQSKLALQMAQGALQAEFEAAAEGGVLSSVELARLHFLTGRLERKTGQLDQALHHFAKALQILPENLDIYLELGQTYQDRRELDQALQVYQKAIEYAPQDARPYRQAGLALKDSKDYQAAEQMIRKAAELSPHDISIHRLLGSLVALNLVHNAG